MNPCPFCGKSLTEIRVSNEPHEEAVEAWESLSINRSPNYRANQKCVFRELCRRITRLPEGRSVLLKYAKLHARSFEAENAIKPTEMARIIKAILYNLRERNYEVKKLRTKFEFLLRAVVEGKRIK